MPCRSLSNGMPTWWQVAKRTSPSQPLPTSGRRRAQPLLRWSEEMQSVPEYDNETKPLARATFRATLADVAAQARAILPEAVNGRIDSAVKLVLAGEVLFHADGTAAVG